MKTYIKPKTFVERAVHNECPECGGDTVINKERRLASGAITVTLKCKVCGKYHSVNKKKLEKIIK